MTANMGNMGNTSAAHNNINQTVDKQVYTPPEVNICRCKSAAAAVMEQEDVLLLYGETQYQAMLTLNVLY